MKRKIFVILGAFALAVGLIACGNSSDSSTAATSAPVADEDSREARPEEVAADSGGEKSTSETPTENTDEDDNITIFEESPKKLLREEIWHSSEDGHVLRSYRYEYDEAGHLSKYTDYSDSGDISSWREYEYDDNGHRIYSAEGCKVDGSIDTWYEYEYNENGKKIHETRGGGSVAAKFSNYLCEYDYDIFGNLVSSTSYSSVTALTITSEYDGNENEIKRTTLDRNSGKITLCEYEYDSNGNLIRTIQTTDELTIVIQEAAYDNNGNQLEEKTYNYGDSIYNGSINVWHEYEYDSNGNKIKHEIRNYNPDGSIDTWYGYEYDSNGNETKYERKIYNNDGICFRYERYEKEYDNDGNIIKEIQYIKDDSINFENEYEYEYDYEYQYKEKGYLVLISKVSKDGTIYNTEYEYDEEGNTIKEPGLGCWIEYVFE